MSDLIYKKTEARTPALSAGMIESRTEVQDLESSKRSDFLPPRSRMSRDNDRGGVIES